MPNRQLLPIGMMLSNELSDSGDLGVVRQLIVLVRDVRIRAGIDCPAPCL